MKRSAAQNYDFGTDCFSPFLSSNLIMRFHRILLYTNQLSALRDFYKNILQLPVDVYDGKIAIKTGKTELVFEQLDTPCQYHFAFNIPQNQIEQALEWLKEKVTLLIDPETNSTIIDFVSWNAHSLYFLDPAGNVVEFIARHDMENGSKSTFGAGSILNVSEIGMPVESIEKAFTQLQDYFRLNRYSGNYERFCAAGDEEGLFILVQKTHKWFPTEIPSHPYSFICEASYAGKKGILKFDQNNLHIDPD